MGVQPKITTKKIETLCPAHNTSAQREVCLGRGLKALATVGALWWFLMQVYKKQIQPVTRKLFSSPTPSQQQLIMFFSSTSGYSQQYFLYNYNNTGNFHRPLSWCQHLGFFPCFFSDLQNLIN